MKNKKMKKEFLVNPEIFLKGSRIDLIPKIFYIKNKEENINSDFFTHMYVEHIRAFNKFNEENKKSERDFILAFDEIIKSIKEKGFKKKSGLIPITNDLNLINGAHRIATSIFLKKKIYAEILKEGYTNYNYSYFKKRGLPELFLDEIIFQYFKLKKKNLYASIFWGSSLKKFNQKEIKEELKKENIDLVYSKEVYLTEKGRRNIIITCYENEPWIDKENNFSGAFRKMVPCFKNSNKIRFFLLESKNKQNIINFKKKIREKLKIGNHSLHTANTYEETRNLCDLLLNKNSLFFLNHGVKIIMAKPLNKKRIKKRNNFAINSSYLLEIFGIRKAKDIDYISNNNLSIKELGSNHNHYFSPEEIKDLIYNPKNFFRFRGIKFLTLENILKFKKRRNEKKDRRDIILIEKFLNKNNKFNYRERILKFQIKIIYLSLDLIKKIPPSFRMKIKRNKIINLLYKKIFY